MKTKLVVGSIIAVALLTLVSFTSVVGYSSVKSNPSNTIITDELDFEYCKDYLFETLVEISNNEDVKYLINNNNQNLFPTNPNHRLLMPFRRNTNRMSLSVEKLDFLYNIGIKLIDRLGEDKVAEIMENVEIDKPDYADELDNIVMGNDELRERIYTLNEMNNEEVSILGKEYFPIICGIVVILCVIMMISAVIIGIPGLIIELRGFGNYEFPYFIPKMIMIFVEFLIIISLELFDCFWLLIYS